MGLFADKRKEIADASKASGRKTFNKNDFNELFTAAANDAGHEVPVLATEDGKQVTKKITPAADFRKSVIGGIMKAAGHDTAEQQKFVEEYQFGRIPAYELVANTVEEYMRAGKAFPLLPSDDCKCTLTMKEIAPEVKEVKSPQSNEKKNVKYDSYMKVKSSSKCPAHRRHDM